MPADRSQYEAALEALRRSEARFEALARLSPDIISIIDRTGRLIYNSQAALRIHGYTEEEMTGRDTFELIHPEDRDRVYATMLDVNSRPGGLGSVQYRYRNKDGSYVWMEATAYNQLDNPLIEGLIGISRDIGERKKQEAALHDALAARDEFMSVAAHELKTPLTVLKMQLQLARRRAGTQAAGGDIDAALGQVSRLAALVRDLLDVTRIRAGKLAFVPEEVNLTALVIAAAEELRAVLEGAGCALAVDAEPGLVARADSARIGQIVSNLLANAVKHAPGGPVRVSLCRAGANALLAVADAGPGIAPEAQERIFRRFEQADAGGEGLGLGLFIVSSIAEGHGGRVWVESDMGRGATFYVELPVVA